MSVNKERLRYLLQAYIDDNLDESELWELKSYLSETGIEADLHQVIDDIWAKVDVKRPLSVTSELIFRKIWSDPRVLADNAQHVEKNGAATIHFPWRLAASLAAMLCVAFSLFFYMEWGVMKQNNEEMVHSTSQQSILPGGNKAMLTLADGRMISLDEVTEGDLAEQAGVRVVKTTDGQLFYELIRTVPGDEIMYNTVSTPNGGEYQLVLPDGTKVWLNAASTLRYPVRFTGDLRRVELTGEAYFEVNRSKAKDALLPFVVKTTSQEVEVLGTHFNIKAYPEESITKTTLLEGSVRISIPSGNQLPATNVLKPNQQSIIKSGSHHISIAKVDPSNAIAWKNGNFAFHDNDITEVMNTISRWYNVEVEYEGDSAKNKVFGGTISKFESFEKLLETIALIGTVKFRIEGRRVIVMT